jgi:propionyl-CoA synthetase
MTSLFRSPSGLKEKYFIHNPDFLETGDMGYFDPDGYLFVMTRSGDLINVAGHRLSTGSLEEALGSHPDVAECAVVGLTDQVKGQVPLGFVVASSARKTLCNRQLSTECADLVRKKIGAVASFHKVIVVRNTPSYHFWC